MFFTSSFFYSVPRFQFSACIQHIHCRFCVLCIGWLFFDVCLTDTETYLKHIISTYLQYLSSLFFFHSGRPFIVNSLFLWHNYLHQACSLTANRCSCVIPLGFHNEMLLICFEICGLQEKQLLLFKYASPASLFSKLILINAIPDKLRFGLSRWKHA